MTQSTSSAARSPRRTGSPGAWIVAGAILAAAAIVSWTLWVVTHDAATGRATSAAETLTGPGASDPNPPERALEMANEIQATLRNAAVAMESWATGNGGPYLGATLADLYEEGLRVDPEVTVTLETTDAGYCVVAVHSMLPPDSEWRAATFDSAIGEVLASNSC